MEQIFTVVGEPMTAGAREREREGGLVLAGSVSASAASVASRMRVDCASRADPLWIRFRREGRHTDLILSSFSRLTV